MRHKCKFCPRHFPSYRAARHHVEEDHPQEFLKVAQWLGKTVDPVLQHYEKLAQEGMTGHRERKER